MGGWVVHVGGMGDGAFVCGERRGRSLWIGLEEKTGRGNGVSWSGLVWLPGPVGAGRARESGIFHSILSSTLAVHRADRSGRRMLRVILWPDNEVQSNNEPFSM